jgi:magnesium transporter
MPQIIGPSRWKIRRRRPAPAGTRPGRLELPETLPPPTLSVFAYGPEDVQFHGEVSIDELSALRDRFPVLWLDVDGLGDISVLERIGEIFGLHRLTLEDVIDVGQRPKVEPYPEYVFVVVGQPRVEEREIEQMSLFLGEGFVVTIQEKPGDRLDGVRTRIREGQGRIRAMGADYLAYAILDAVVDGYFPILEDLGEELDDLEVDVLKDPQKETLTRIHDVRRLLHAFRRTVWPQREAIHMLARDLPEFIGAETAVYMRDCYDHTIQVRDLLESYREVASDLMGMYLSSVNNRMNEVMKVLTIIATIFIPLSFLAGVYGMNFNPNASRWNMPELNWIYGYPFTLGLMAVVAALLLSYFWRKGWFD